MVPVAGTLILVLGLSVALVLDRLWIDAAQVELRTGAEAAALAAAGELCNDTKLLGHSTTKNRMANGRNTARFIASQNRVAGQILQLNDAPDGDIHFGKLLHDETANQRRFVETPYEPNCVAVFARCTKRRGNPIALLFRDLTGQNSGNVSDTAEAIVDNRVIGLEAFHGLNIPALPLAIKQSAQSITQDELGYDHEQSRVIFSADGLPEFKILSTEPKGSPTDCDLFWVDLGTGLSTSGIVDQIYDGISVEDLVGWNGQLRFDEMPQQFFGSGAVPSEIRESLQNIMGQKRICFVYSEAAVNTANGTVMVTCIQPTAVRILDIYTIENGRTEIIFQPCVITTKTAITHPSPIWTGDGNEYQNSCIYKISLSH